MPTLGEYLKSKRLEKGIHLEEIASVTKIPLYSLLLIEDNKWDELPASPFVRGFIISYTKFLGLPSNELLKQYQEEVSSTHTIKSQDTLLLNTQPPISSSHNTTPITEPPSATKLSAFTSWLSQKHFPEFSLGNIASGIVALSVLIIIWRIVVIGQELSHTNANAKKDTAPTTTHQVAVTATTIETPLPPSSLKIASSNTTPPPTPPSLAAQLSSEKIPDVPPLKKNIPKDLASDMQLNTQAESQAESQPKSQAKTQTKELTVSHHQIHLKANDRSWVKVVHDDAPPVSFVIHQGEERTYAADKKIKIVLGNADAVDLTYNGAPSMGRVDHGTIRYFIFPFGSRFPQDNRKVASTPPKSNKDEALAGEIKQEAPVDKTNKPAE